MAKQLPDNWSTLNVGNDLGLRGDYPRNLAVYKVKGTKLLGCRWLPAEEEDTRPNQGRTNGGKRKYIFGRTGCDDPFQAGKTVIIWCKEQRKDLQKKQRSRNINLVIPSTITGIFGSKD